MDSPAERSNSSPITSSFESSPLFGNGGSGGGGGGGGGGGNVNSDLEEVLDRIFKGQEIGKYDELVVIDFIPQCQHILANSSLLSSHIVCTKIMEEIIRKFWNTFSVPQKLELKTFLLTLLDSKANVFDKRVIQALVRCLAKIYKLGWFDDESLRDSLVVSDKFMAASPNHYLVGIYLLYALTEEMNTVSADQPLSVQRKYTNSFRDLQLLDVFKLSLSTLREIRTGALSAKGVPDDVIQYFSVLALNLANVCLNYDFQGNNIEESYEDSGTVQVPAAWKSTVLDPFTMQILFEFYSAGLGAAHTMLRSHRALEVLICLSSVRQSIFSNDNERNSFITQLITGLVAILKGQIGLNDENNYHQFCRLLSRIKTNYRLNELLKIPGFNEFLELSCQFTLEALKTIEDQPICVSYILAYWSRLVAALPYIRSSSSETAELHAAAPAESGSMVIQRLNGAVLQGYISNVMSLSERQMRAVNRTGAGPEETTVDEDKDNLLDDESALRDQMDRFLVMAHCQYEAVSRLLVGLYDNLLAMYNQPQPMQTLYVVEEKLSWLTEMIAACIGPSGVAETHKNEDIFCDGELCRRVFQLIDVCANRVKAGLAHASIHLEKAVLQFFRSFKKGYILDMLSHVPININSYNISTPPPHRLHARLSLSGTGTGTGGNSSASTPRASTSTGASMGMGMGMGIGMGIASEQQYQHQQAERERVSVPVSIFDAINIGDLAQVMNIIVYKLCSNVNSIGIPGEDRSSILNETLEIFVDLISSYSSSKMLLNLESIQSIVKDHTGDRFKFLRFDNDNKHRIKFYSAIMRLVFTSSEDMNNSFDVFIAPNVAFLEQLWSSIPDQRKGSDYRVAVIQILRDFRGIAQATYNKRTYNLLFEALYPRYFQLFLRVAEQFSGDVEVCIALLKFLQEFVLNKSSRIAFDMCSPNGILLFREVSKVLCTIGSQLMSTTVDNDIYREKYKVMKSILFTLVNSLSGGYVEIGVFAFYNDPALSNVIQLAMQICLKIPRGHLFEYTKLAKSYFSFLEVLFRNHLDMLCQLDSATFVGVLLSLLVGLDSSDTIILTSCAITIDHLATYVFLNRNRLSKPTMQRIYAHLTEYPDALNQCMYSLFQVFLLTGNTWGCTRPILSLLLAHNGCYTYVRDELITSQQSESGRRQLADEFSKLIADLQQSLEISNRDRFTQKLISFKTNTRELF